MWTLTRSATSRGRCELPRERADHCPPGWRCLVAGTAWPQTGCVSSSHDRPSLLFPRPLGTNA